MAINEPLPTRLTPMDQAVITYHSAGEDFVKLLDSYISSYPEAKRYVFFAPNIILLGHEETRVNPNVWDSPKRNPYWLIAYAQGLSIASLVPMMPYYLDTIGFNRYLKYPDKPIKFISTDKILSRYGQDVTKTSKYKSRKRYAS